MRIIGENSLVIAIDFQEKLMPVIMDNETVAKNSATLIEGCRELQVPIFVTQQYTKGLGETIGEISDAMEEFDPFEKKTFSAWQTEEIRNAIMKTGRKNIIVCGVEAHICVLQTVIDLIGSGYTVAVVADCVGSRKKTDKKYALKRAKAEGAYLTTYEAILYEMTEGADSPHFKAISKLTK